MRVTSVCLVKNWYTRRFKFLWKVGSVRQAPEVYIPPSLLEKGVEIVDTAGPNFLGDKKFTPFEWPDPRMNKFRRVEERPDYHESPRFFWDYQSFPRQGLEQVLCLTKAVIQTDTLPSRIKCNVGKISAASNQDEILKNGIMWALKWDATRDKLPLRRDPNKMHIRPKRQFGNLDARKQELINLCLARICDLMCGKWPKLLRERRFMHNYRLCVNVETRGDPLTIAFERENIAYMTKKQEDPFADEKQVAETVTEIVPDLYPLKPTAGLDEINLYNENDNCPGVSKTSQFVFPYGVFVTAGEPRWTATERCAKALIAGFAHCAATAKALHGADIKKLPKPICARCVVNDAKTVDVVCFQLNTLDLKDDTGVKNLVWVDKNNHLYSDVQDNELNGYNELALQKVLAVLADGLGPLLGDRGSNSNTSAENFS